MGTLMLSSSSCCASSQQMVFHRLLRPAPILSLCLPHHKTTSLHPIITNNSSSLIFRTFSNNPSVVISSSPQALLESPNDEEIEKESNGEVISAERKSTTIIRRQVPNLTVKEKKELASYAHSLGKKVKSQQVGKSGVTDSVVFALDETLESNELLKLKIHGTCPGGELEDIVKHLEEATGSVIIGQIGRTVILYRPSVTKMKAEEKKKQAQIAFMKKQAARQSFQGKSGLVPKTSGRGRRGSSRNSSG